MAGWCSVSVRIRIAGVGLVGGWLWLWWERSHTFETSFLAPLERVVEHRFIRDGKQGFRQVFCPREGVERSARAT